MDCLQCNTVVNTSSNHKVSQLCLDLLKGCHWGCLPFHLLMPFVWSEALLTKREDMGEPWTRDNFEE